MRPTKCDQAQVKRTLCSGARGQNEGKFGGFRCGIFDWVRGTLPSIAP